MFSQMQCGANGVNGPAAQRDAFKVFRLVNFCAIILQQPMEDAPVSQDQQPVKQNPVKLVSQTRLVMASFNVV